MGLYRGRATHRRGRGGSTGMIPRPRKIPVRISSVFHRESEDNEGIYSNPSPSTPHLPPHPPKAGKILWSLWCCGYPWETVKTYQQVIHLLVWFDSFYSIKNKNIHPCDVVIRASQKYFETISIELISQYCKE